MRVKSIVCSLLLLVALAIVAPACHKKLTPASPIAAAAMKADDAVIRINELQAAVIQVCGPEPQCAPNTLATNLARDIVKVCIDLRTTLKQVPVGWQATVKTAWTQAKQRFTAVTDPSVRAAIALVNTAVEAL